MRRVLIHDYGAYSFPLDLSEELAARGNGVLHLCHQDIGHPRSMLLSPRTQGLTVREVRYDYDKYNLAAKPFHDHRYGCAAAVLIRDFKPHLVISSNTPLNAQFVIQRATRTLGATFVYWIQDIISEGIHVALARRNRWLARIGRATFGALEKRLLRGSDFVVAASPDFLPHLNHCGVRATRIRVIDNWARLADISPVPQDNPWSRAHGLAGKPCVIYSGTLGLKHDPHSFLRIARILNQQSLATFVVVAEGPGADWLKREFAREMLPRSVVLPLQPYSELPLVLGSAAILFSSVSPAASRFCFPSKTLSYLCSGRPIVFVSPPGTHLARRLGEAGAATVVPPDSPGEVARIILALLRNDELASSLAAGALRFAHSQFPIGPIADQFESTFALAGCTPPLSPSKAGAATP
ncbi:MAG: hypothetical protein C0504_00130 [Candidatus Solibacter sp.]|nr:hypothetical protein [Candidatus Solibacter sp.]